MTTTDRTITNEPVDAVLERLNDPAVAASLVTLLDNAELLSTLVLGLTSLLERGDTIMDSVSTGVNELKTVSTNGDSRLDLPTPAEVTGLVSALAKSTPVITEVLDSSMVSSETVELLSLVSAAASEGAAQARRSKASVTGLRATLRALKDPEVGRGLGLLIEISKALGRRLDASAT